MRDLQNLLPYPDPIVVLQVSGQQLYDALENSVSQWPEEVGRFASVAGMTYSFSADRPSGSRIDPTWIRIGDEPLDLKRVSQQNSPKNHW